MCQPHDKWSYNKKKILEDNYYSFRESNHQIEYTMVQVGDHVKKDVEHSTNIIFFFLS